METITVIIPNNNVSERTYIINIFFQTLLNVPIEIKVSENINDYIISFLDTNSKKKEIVVEDHFFGNFSNKLSYLDKSNIPNEPVQLSVLDCNITFLYGRDYKKCSENRIVIGADIFASAFFLVTRWEEFVIGREENGDCDENELFIIRNNLYRRPLIHEYEFFLAAILRHLGYSFKEERRRFSIFYTLDVDNFNQITWKGVYRYVRSLLRQGYFKGSMKCIYNNFLVKTYTANRKRLFLKHIEFGHKFSAQSCFFMKCCEKGEQGATYTYKDKAITSISHLLKKENAITAFHPSENTFNDNEQFDREITRFEEVFKHTPQYARNHTLRYNSNTYKQLKKYGIKFVSNCGFHTHNGFRAGISVPFPVFNIFERKEIDLIEIPFEIMDLAISKVYNKMNDAWHEIEEIIKYTKLYNCTLVTNWHIIVYFSMFRIRESLRFLDKILYNASLPNINCNR